MNFEALTLVTQRPDPKLKVENATCPFCDSDNYASHGVRSTLMTFANHHWHERTCNKCQQPYTVEEKSGNVWITDKNNHVLSGIPSCFENYTYDCNCGGVVTRQYRQMDGVTTSGVLLGGSFKDGAMTKSYRTFYVCARCNKEIETSTDYFIK